jgi:hypothetical protein
MSLQKQYTIYCEGIYCLFGRSGVSAPVGVNREWRALVCRPEVAHLFGKQWKLRMGFGTIWYNSQRALVVRIQLIAYKTQGHLHLPPSIQWVLHLHVYDPYNKPRLFHENSGVPRNFFGWGVSTNSVEDTGQREWGSGGGSPLVRGSEGSCNLVQEISFHIVKFS